MIIFLRKSIPYQICFFIFFPNLIFAQIFITGNVKDINQKNLSGVNILIENSAEGTYSDGDGNYFLKCNLPGTFVLRFSYVGFKEKKIKISQFKQGDTLVNNIKLNNIYTILPTFNVSSFTQPDTVFASVTYNISDFEFFKDKLILLAYENKPGKETQVILTDENSNLIDKKKSPFDTEELFNDFNGNINLVSGDAVSRILIRGNEISFLPVNFSDFSDHIKPCVEKLGEKIFFSDYYFGYPEFNYYSYSIPSEKTSLIKKVIDKPLMQEYRYQYYFLTPTEKLKARRLASEYHTDKHIMAAALTGFQKSFYYSPLYAPLFLINDSIFIFDHYEDKLFVFDEFSQTINSVSILYHKNPVEHWEKKMVMDETNKKIYSLYKKNGYYYLKRIDLKSGEVISSFKLFYKYAEKIKIKNDYVYYIYRPFESLQKKFLYREFIGN